MMMVEPNRQAALVASIHAPWRATVAECIGRWASLDDDARARSYLVVEGDEHGLRHTLSGSRIAELSARLGQDRRAAA